MLSLGIDIGSLSTDAVLMNEKKEILASEVIATGASSKKAADRIWEKILESNKLSGKDIDYVVATGYGRIKVPFAHEVVTEITCHARGANFYFPKARTVIDIGGQDSKVIKMDSSGNVIDFVMNDKCAAGTGRFLEVMARTLEIELEEMGPLSLQGGGQLSISSLCTVFAESEVVSLVGADHKREDICRALHMAIAKRIVAQARRVGTEEQVVMSGGVAKNIGMVKEMERLLSTRLKIAPEPQIVGAVGAALIGLEAAGKKLRPPQPQVEVQTTGLAPYPQPSLISTELAPKVEASLEDGSLPKIGYLCTYTPIEIIRAAGFHPFRIKGAEKAEGAAEEHLCTNLCPYIKAVMEEKLSGALEGLEGMVFVNSCDGMRRLYDAWRGLDGDKKFNFMLDLPKTNDEAAVHYYATLIRYFKERLERSFHRTVSLEDINKSIDLYNKVRGKVKIFLQKQWSGHLSHSGYQIFSLLKRGVNAVPEKFHEYLTHLMKEKGPVVDTGKVPRLLIWGGILENEEILKIIEEAGARVVADDLCSGTRFYDALVELTDDPFSSLARGYLRRSPCSRMINVFERIHNILSIIERNAVHGAIYHTLKFCDHSLYDFPLIKKEFEKRKIPLLHLTCDYTPSSHGQIRTRVEAFLEQLQNTRN